MLGMTHSRAFLVVSMYSSTLQVLKGLRPWRTEAADFSSPGFNRMLCSLEIADLRWHMDVARSAGTQN